jgi:hypothetical protein
MNLLRHGIILAALANVACGSGDDDDRPKFMGARTGGKTGTGGFKASGGSKNSGGTAGDGGIPETGGADGSGGSGGGGAGTGGSGGAGGTAGTGGAGGAGGAVVEPTCTLSTGNVICDGCIHSDCSFDCAACEGNEDCTAILDCVLTACTSGFNNDCMSPCFADHSDGYNAFNKVVFGCGQQACSSFCPFAP